MTRAWRPVRGVLMTAIAVLCAGRPIAAQLFDPGLRFRQLTTEHFVLYFHQGEERLAQRLAPIAEETWRTLQQRLGVTPPRRTRVVLADQTELFNGYATPVPYDTVVLYAVTPSGSDADFDDWLRLIFTHEFTHIVHLDRSESWARVLRGILGRTPYAFPNIFLPQWQIEGLAVFEESSITGMGRLHAGDFLAIVNEGARDHRLEPLDRVNGGLTDWPSGASVYAYGAGFHQYLVDRYGAQTLATLAEATARRVPYVASPVFKRIFGESLGDLWRDYEASLAGKPSDAPPADAAITRLTWQGFSMSGPRFDRYSCAGCPPDIVYSAVNPNGFPALYRVGLDAGTPRRLTTRYLGSTTGVGRDRIYFDQLELNRNVGLYGDLYEYSRTDGHVRRLTSDARLLDPDLSPDGQTLICVRNSPGQRDLVLVPLRSTVTARGDETPATTLLSEAGTQYDAPRWSPDGRTIAVGRHRLGAEPEIVLVDVATKTVRVLAAAPRTRFAMPAWRPDGLSIVAAAARGDETFNLFEFPVNGSSPRQLTHTSGGALWPDVSPDGQTIVFVGYTADGDDLFSMPYPAAGTDDAVAFNRAAADAVVPRGTSTQGSGVDVEATATTYSPLDTLKPTSWTPIVVADSDQVRVGAAVTGYDVLGYHAYAATATWLVSSPAGAITPAAATPDWQATYLYNRWRPTLYLTAASDTSFFAGPATDLGTPTSTTRRERQIEGGLIYQILHTRAQHVARFAVVRALADYTTSTSTFSRDRTPVRLSWATLTGRTYGYSISPEDGIAIGATTEIVRQSLGSFADATTTTGDARAYLPGFAPHHVVALRIGGGASIGDPTVGRTFLMGGDSPGDGVADLSSDAFSLMRGFEPNTFAGSHVAIANAEYRWPIARPQRGHGTWPLFLHTLHAAVFADAGYAWTRAFDRYDIKSSAGAQLSADFVAGFYAPFTVSVGAAWGHDGGGRLSDRATVFFRVGKGF